jgi:hypothetical protein
MTCDPTPQSKIKHTDGKYYCPASAPWATGARGSDQRDHPDRLKATTKKKMFDFACMKTQACAQEYNTRWSIPERLQYKYGPVKLDSPPAGVVPVAAPVVKITDSTWAAFKKRADSKSVALFVALFVVAFYMSWACNGSLGAVPRFGYALLAGIFGFFYVAYALLFKYKSCSAKWV